MNIGFSFQNRLTRYWIIAIIWMFLSISLGYKYVSSMSDPASSKGGTLVEATIEKPDFLPYLTTTEADKFRQSLLFQGCSYPVFSGTQISFIDDLCVITTTDYQTFTVQIASGAKRSDDTPVTINDVYFTYKSIIKDNYRNVPHLEGYTNIKIDADTDANELKFIFPKATRDNMIFFTNFILPAHILANVSLEEYMVRFLQNPTGSACARLQTAGKEGDNYIFDLSNCKDFSLKNYQVKWFKDQAALDAYTKDNKSTIDLSFDQLPEDVYETIAVPRSSYLSFFLNTARTNRTARQRQGVATIINSAFQSANEQLNDLYATDPYLFTLPTISVDEAKKRLLPVAKPVEQTGTQIVQLPEHVNLREVDPTKVIYTVSNEITDKVSFFIDLPGDFSRVSVTPQGGKEYFPVSYNSEKKSFQYNLSIIYKTVQKGENSYVIKGYQGEQVVKEWVIKIWYLDQPPAPEPLPAPEAKLDTPFTIIYFEDPTTKVLVDILRSYFEQQHISDQFVFESFIDANSLEGKLTTKEYDIALRTIHFGLRKDLSGLLTTDNPVINPSLLINEQLSNLITRFFLSDNDEQKSKLQDEIRELHRQNPQLIVLGKLFGKIRIKKADGIQYTEKTYNIGWRRPFLKNVELFHHVAIDRNKVWKRKNFWNFVTKTI